MNKDKNKERIIISGKDGFVDMLNAEVEQLQKKPERITIEISAELKKKVVVYCAENGIKSMKELITKLLEETIKN